MQLLDLRVCDTALPRVRVRYAVMAAGQGGATAVAVTGAVVSSTVTGGVTASAAIAAVAADAAATLAFMGRITALVAAHYGYDVREPEEEVFALGVLSLASAGTQGGKTQTLRSLSRLTQQMMRQATWTQFRGNQLVGVIEKVYLELGFQLTKTKLAQAVPVAGVVLNAGLSAQLADQTFRRAGDAYRLRFLSEKYGTDPEAWLEQTTSAGPDDDEAVVDVTEIVAGEVVDTPPATAVRIDESLGGTPDGKQVDRVVGLVEERIGPDLAPWPGGWPNDIELALIDAVLSIRANYGSPTIGVRRRCASWRVERGGGTCDDLAELAKREGEELSKALDNEQRLSGGLLKTAAIVVAAGNLRDLGVRHADIDPQSREHKRAYTTVKGLGGVTWDYLLMLLGKPGVKADTRIRAFVAEALDVSDVDARPARELVLAAADRLSHDPSQLDHAIWLHMRSRSVVMLSHGNWALHQLARPNSAHRCSRRSPSGQSRRRSGSSRTRPCIACRPCCNIGPSTSSSSAVSIRTS